ncbi:MAG: PAS domain-containing protein, partial [Candidatus Micrarchaeaceae archaeon]
NLLNQNITDLRQAMKGATTEKMYIFEQLNKALVEKADLEGKLLEITHLIMEKNTGEPVIPRSSDAIVIVSRDDTGTITYATEGCLSLLGYTPKELTGRPLAILIPDLLQIKHERLRKAYNQHPEDRFMGDPHRMSLEARNIDGINIPVAISCTQPETDG